MSNPEININSPHRRPCGKGGMKSKAIEISNALRNALGLPLIKEGANPTHFDNMVIAPGAPVLKIWASSPPLMVPHVDPNQHMAAGPILSKPAMHHWRHQSGVAREPFLKRVHIALMELGPWEGRAVAFVLGASLYYAFDLYTSLSALRMWNWSFAPPGLGHTALDLPFHYQDIRR
jgi:hypothetical protein